MLHRDPISRDLLESRDAILCETLSCDLSKTPFSVKHLAMHCHNPPNCVKERALGSSMQQKCYSQSEIQTIHLNEEVDILYGAYILSNVFVLCKLKQINKR